MESTLLSLLREIVRTEHAQWMRYTYLSTLRHGLHTDTFHEHFAEHAGDELQHASTISRWVVDLGGVPPTDFDSVEEFQGGLEDSLEWLITAELNGINLYQLAHQASESINGLQNDIDDILSAEHEHLSDLLKWSEPHHQHQDDDTLIILTAQFRQINPLHRFAGVRRAAKTLYEYLEDTLQAAWYKYEYDYTPEKGRQYILDDTKRQIEFLYDGLKDGDTSVKPTLQFNLDLYKFITRPDVEKNWLQYHYAIWPEYHRDPTWGGYEVPESQPEPPKPTFEQKLPSVEEEIKKPEPVKPAPKPTQTTEELKRQIQETQQQIERLQTPGRKERRPGEEEIGRKVEVYDAGKSHSGTGKMFEVGPGDRIKNITLSGEDIPSQGRPGRAKWTLGTITNVTEDGMLQVNTEAGQQLWDPEVDLIEIDLRDREKFLLKQES